jgi:hypothetical protein
MSRATGFADLETPDEKRQRQASEYHQAQQVKTIHEGQHGCLSGAEDLPFAAGLATATPAFRTPGRRPYLLLGPFSH